MRLKEVIDGRALIASRARRKKRYHFPNESVLLPLASWSSSGVSAQASVSPIVSQARSVQRYPIEGPSHGTALPPTPPRSPSQPNHNDRSIEDKELPYCRFISLTSLSLHLELGTLSLTFDFLQVLSGCLSIVQLRDDIALSGGYRTIEMENISTTAELNLDCSHGSNELAFQLRIAQRGLVYISFVWEEITIGENG